MKASRSPRLAKSQGLRFKSRTGELVFLLLLAQDDKDNDQDGDEADADREKPPRGIVDELHHVIAPFEGGFETKSVSIKLAARTRVG